MFRLGKWFAVGLVVCVFTIQEARAALGFQPVSPDELKMTSEPLAPGAPAIILYRQVDRDDNIHTPHEDNYVRIKILTEEGRKHADVEIPFLRENQDVVNVKARTIRPDGSIADFDDKVFVKTLVKGRVEGRDLKVLAKTFTLPDVQVGSIIEYSYIVDYHDHMLFESRWVLSDELFTKKARFSLKPFNDMSYGLWSFRWSWNTLPPGAVAPKEGPDGTVTMEASNIPAFQMEDHMPPATELMSRVDFIYTQGYPDKDQETYWKHVGKKRNGELESFVGNHKVLELVVAQIVAPNDSQEVKLRKIYDRVQQLRNTSFEVQKTEQEQKRAKEKTVDVDAVDVWRRGFGTGAQLTWLFLGLARAAGFEAYGCSVSDRKEYFFSPVTMQGDKLSASVALVKLNGKDFYLDPGTAFTPYGLLTWAETGVAGLRLDRDGGAWIKTTLPGATESRIERVGKLKLSEAGDLEGKLTVTYIGLEAMYRRLAERDADEVARKKYLEELVTRQIGVASEVELTNKPDWIDSETPLIAEFNLKIPGWASNAGKRAIVPAAIFTAAEKGMFEHAHRVQSIYFEYPYEKADDVNIELPSEWQVGNVPPARNQNGHVIRYALNVDTSPGTLHLTRKLSVDILLMEQKYYSALRDFFQVVRSGDAEQVVLLPGGVRASN